MLDPNVFPLVERVLEEARVDVLDRLVEAGGSPSIRGTRTVVRPHRESKGWTTDAEPYRRSGIHDLEHLLAISEIDRGTMYWSSLRGICRPLCEYVDAHSELGKTSYQGVMPEERGEEGVFMRVVAPMAVHYLRSLSDLSVPDPKSVQRLSNELVDLMANGYTRAVQQIPVDGITVDEPIEYRSTKIRPLTAAEQGHYLESTSEQPIERSYGDFAVPASPSVFLPVTLLETEVEADPPWATPKRDALRSLLLAIFLAGFELSSPGYYARFPRPQWAGVGFHSSPIEIQERTVESQHIDETTFCQVVDLAGRIPEFSSPETSRNDIVFGRLFKGASGQDGGFLDLVVSLEAALLQGIRSELRYRFALYGALFLADVRPTGETFEALKDVYDVRSALVHGSPVKGSDLAKARRQARDIAFAVVRQIVDGGWPIAEELDQTALGFLDRDDSP